MDPVEIIIPIDHPSTIGHFPGNPIVPGATLLSEVIGAWEGLVGATMDSTIFKVAKFLSPTRPGDRVSIRFEPIGVASVKFNCAVNDRTVLSGSFAYTLTSL